LYFNRPKGLGTADEEQRKEEWEIQLENLGTGLLADAANRAICTAQTESAGATLGGIADRVVAKLEYGQTENAARCYLRLLEGLAKQADTGYKYAGWSNNLVNGSDNPLYNEGGDFLSSAGRGGTLPGLHNFDDLLDVVDSNPCKVLRTITKSIGNALALESQIDAQPVVWGKRYVFRQYLLAALAGTQWAYGMDFLPSEPPPPVETTPPLVTPPVDTTPPQPELIPPAAPSKSPIVPIAIAAIGAYFLAKG
jgi:hypothetical protein